MRSPNAIASTFIWQTVLMGLLGLSGVVFMPLMLRYVDAGIMASVFVAQVYVYYLLLLVQFGFNWSCPAAVARAAGPSEEASIWRTSNRIRLSLLIGPTAIIFVIGFWALGLEGFYLFGFWLLISATAVNSNWLLQARLDFFSGVAFAFLGVVASAILSFLMLNGDNVLSNSWLTGLCVICVLTFPPAFLGVGSWWLSRKICREFESIPLRKRVWHSDLKQLSENLPLVATQLLQLISATLGTVVVGALSDVLTTNAYAAMERLFNLSASVIVALYMSAYPRLAASFYQNRLQYWRLVWQQLRLGGALGLAVMTAFIFFGETLLSLYVSEPLALKVTSVMCTFAAWLGLYLTQHVLSGYFVFAQRNRMVLVVNLLVLLVTVGVGYPLATKDPVLWVYGMLAGQVFAAVWLFGLYHQDKQI